jgi:Tfp pilus assembly PilM family ATPase
MKKIGVAVIKLRNLRILNIRGIELQLQAAIIGYLLLKVDAIVGRDVVDPNAIIKGIRIAIGMVVIKAAEIVITVPLKATWNSQKLNSQQLKLRSLKRNSLK